MWLYCVNGHFWLNTVSHSPQFLALSTVSDFSRESKALTESTRQLKYSPITAPGLRYRKKARQRGNVPTLPAVRFLLAGFIPTQCARELPKCLTDDGKRGALSSGSALNE